MPRVLISPIEIVWQASAARDILEQAGFEVVFPPRGVSLRDPVLLRQHLPGIDGILAGMEPLSREILAASQLRGIARAGVGYDAVDVPAATDLKIAVTITPGTNHVSVAEHTLALMLGVTRGFPTRDQQVRRGQWQRILWPRLDGRTLGLIGLGRIGQAVVPRAQGLGKRVIAHDPLADNATAAQLGIELVTLPELLAQAHVVSLHLPCTAATTGMINRETLAQMRQGAVLINTARGGLVDEDALADALASGHLAGAGLDAFVVEPLPTTSRLLTLDNVLLSPHTAGVDVESIVAMTSLAAQCLVDLHAGRTLPPGCLVNPQLGPDWKW